MDVDEDVDVDVDVDVCHIIMRWKRKTGKRFTQTWSRRVLREGRDLPKLSTMEGS